ncbi:MAG: crossover junction endodeoxyribonuclease RuvC [Rickettsiales bacterium]|nr:crossover junction endodeoxyribonuclease RuvC [Rickettsiales bacterium]
MTVILGVDPGLQRTGWGILRANVNQLSFIACGVIRSAADMPLSERIQQLHDGLKEAIGMHSPEEAAVEETFVNKSGSSTLKLGQARGGILLTLSLNHLPVYEYSATLVKKSVVGNGHADKAQVGMMVQTLLPACKAKGVIQAADAADALAVAICHAHQRNVRKLTGAL